MPRPKKSEIPAKTTHGALLGPKSVYDIIGQKQNPYDTDDVEEYRKKIEKMNMVDLQAHALATAKVLPLSNWDRPRLMNALERKFMENQHRYGILGAPRQAQMSPETIAAQERLLARAR